MYVIENDINFYEAIKEIEDTHDDEAPMSSEELEAEKQLRLDNWISMIENPAPAPEA